MEKVSYFSTEGKRFFRHDGKCIECNIVKQTIERHKIDGDWQYDFTITVSNNGREYDIKPEDLFESVEDFEKNLPHEPECDFQPGNRFGTNGVCFYVKDSQVLKFNIDANWRTLIYDGKRWECPELPAKYYKEEAVARANNIVVVVDGNGVETEKAGANLLLRLNDEQRAILKDIESLFEKAEAAGIRFFTIPKKTSVMRLTSAMSKNLAVVMNSRMRIMRKHRFGKIKTSRQISRSSRPSVKKRFG